MDTPKSTTSTKQGRDAIGRFLPTTSPEEAKIAALEARITELQISNNHNAAEVTRLAEALRLAEQGRNEAIESRNRFRADLTDANNRERSLQVRLTKAEESEKKAHELLSCLTIEHDALKQEKRTAEGRYLALLRRRSVEIAIVLVAGIGGALLFAIASMIGGTR